MYVYNDIGVKFKHKNLKEKKIKNEKQNSHQCLTS